MNRRRTYPVSDEQLRAALTRRPDPQRMADDLASIFASLERTSQRRWLPARLTAGVARMRSAAVLLAVLALLLAVGIALVSIIGSRQRLPPPFGLARPGLIAFDLDGDIYVTSPDGRGRTQLTSGPDLDGAMTWSPDGTRIAYRSGLADQSTAVVVIDADGGHRIVLADHLAEAGDPVWSPDSRRIVFSARLAGSDAFHVYISPADQPGAIQLGPPNLFAVGPSWSPDGRQIAFKRIYSYGAGAEQGTAPDSLWLIGADGSNPHRLSGATGQNNAFLNTVWSPDGKRLAFIAGGIDGKFDVYVINADGTSQQDISNSAQDEWGPSWSPDGTRIAFVRMRLGQHIVGQLVVADPDGSDAVSLQGPLVNGNPPVWSPDGTGLIAYAKNPGPRVDSNAAMAVFDPSGQAPPLMITAADFRSASWQRLAP